jgi:multiple sugar transport system permease protein
MIESRAAIGAELLPVDGTDSDSQAESSARSRSIVPRRKRHGRWAHIGFLSPAGSLFVVFIVAPTIFAIGLSLFSWDMLTPGRFVGPSNFTDLFGDPLMLRVLANTFAFTVSSVVLHVGLGLLLAMALNRRMNKAVNYFVRAAVFIPFVISWAAVSLTWRQFLDPNTGVVAYYAGLIGWSVPNFFSDPTWALPAIVLLDLWHTLGFTFIILLAGLQAVPKELGEAAQVDGANRMQVFWFITIPYMSPTLLFAMVITFIGAFQVFDPVQIITRGGPENSTKTIIMYLYERAFQNFEMGYASAVAVIVFIVMMAATALQFRLSRRWVHQ